MSLIDFIFGDTDPVDTSGIEEGLTSATAEADAILSQHLNRALSHIAAGNSAAASRILEGLGLSTEEREKWFDIAVDALQPVIEFGQSYMPDARQFMDHAKELVFNPDAIYGTQAWQAYKNQIMESVTNSAAAKSGLLSGNYLQAMSDRVGANALAFRNSEIDHAFRGFASAMVPVSQGLEAQTRTGDFALATGDAIADSILGAHTSLGQLAQQSGVASANAILGTGGKLAANRTGLASNLANLELASMLGERNLEAERQSGLFSLGGSILGGLLGGGSSILDPVIEGLFGGSSSSALPQTGALTFGADELSFNPSAFRQSTYIPFL